ncbi:MAG: GNAT family N-acetyltransferase [Rhodospirillales bacterium]
MTVSAAIRLETLSGAAVMDVVADLARLRVEVFRDFPYLYDGDAVYEERYLAKYARIADATIVVARDGARVVGAATALPLVAAEEEMQAPFAAGGMDPRDWYYFGESVLERAWRGRGIGVAFFAGREARAAALGFRRTAFCAVERPADHPLRPHGYVPLDAFWGRRGYVRRPELRASFDWRDIGQETETPHPMVFWTREA